MKADERSVKRLSFAGISVRLEIGFLMRRDRADQDAAAGSEVRAQAVHVATHESSLTMSPKKHIFSLPLDFPAQGKPIT